MSIFILTPILTLLPIIRFRTSYQYPNNDGHSKTSLQKIPDYPNRQRRAVEQRESQVITQLFSEANRTSMSYEAIKFN